MHIKSAQKTKTGVLISFDDRDDLELSDNCHNWLRVDYNNWLNAGNEPAPYVEPEPDLTALAHAEMARLEATFTPRREREARLGIEGAQQWLDDLDNEIEALRP